MDLDLFRKLYPHAASSGIDAREVPPWDGEFEEEGPRTTIEVHLKLSAEAGAVALPPLVLDERIGLRALLDLIPADQEVWLEIDRLYEVELSGKGPMR